MGAVCCLLRQALPFCSGFWAVSQLCCRFWGSQLPGTSSSEEYQSPLGSSVNQNLWDWLGPLNFCKGGECGRCEEPAAGKGLCSSDPQEQSLQHLCLMHRTSLSNFFFPVLSWGTKQGCKASVCFPCMQRGCSRGSLSCGGPCSWALRAPGAASPCLGGSRAWGLASGAAAAGSGSAVLVVLLHVGGLCKPWHRRPRARG